MEGFTENVLDPPLDMPEILPVESGIMRNSRWSISIKGTVQGVGMRPFIYRLANSLGLSGFVLNTPAGVEIEVEGNDENLSAFLSELRSSPPPLSRIHEIDTKPIIPKKEIGFKIVETVTGMLPNTTISPDIAPCEECVSEMEDEGDRRHFYPFINCVNCGPRYSIIKGLPYDRVNTTMSEFQMCDKCRAEYDDPANRRFHAQPNACPRCGPRLTFVSGGNRFTDDAVSRAVTSLGRGEIVAVKGVGGYHLACDATNDAAVSELRKRKTRDEKPFALMVASLDSAKKLCLVSDDEARLLESRERPIVLLRKRPDARISPLVAPGNNYLGVMLPSAPLHYLLFNQTPEGKSDGVDAMRNTHDAIRVLVMTSGNLQDEPIAYKDTDALSRLRNVADAFLLHDREIFVRADDSIARCFDVSPMIVRRARGFAPAPVRLSFDMPEIAAFGADLKGALCLSKGRNAFLSQHIGDLVNADASQSASLVLNHMMTTLGISPEVTTCDMHPDYISANLARKFSKTRSIDVVPVQHHHAHIASCMAENDLPNEKVIGIALDGTGFGTDGNVWGGEVLVADYNSFERRAHLAYVPMPGGDAAAKETWRMAVAYLKLSAVSYQLSAKTYKRSGLFDFVDGDKTGTVEQMIDKEFNCPMTSSTGRLFDAVASILGIKHRNSFEGQAAQMLEQAADESETGSYKFKLIDGPDTAQICFSEMINAIAEERLEGVPIGAVSMRFHNTIIAALTAACRKIFEGADGGNLKRVCLSGGSFQNAILLHGVKKSLEDFGFKVYTHSLVPTGDGGIALGQAAIAAHRKI